MRAVLPALLLPLAVGCVPIGARTAPPGRGSDNSDSPNSVGHSGGSKIKDAPPASIVVNQVGYFPGLVKLATVRTGGSSPQAWSLVDSAGHEVQSGQTVVADPDTLAGDTVQTADFSSFDQEGHGFVLVVGSARSHPFDISPVLYHKLKYDALTFYYQNRSGIAIAMPYAGGPQWARPAGHLSDGSVPCASGSGCSYRLDVSGGWYDAGDHGKYVVNGGISVWTLLNLYERTMHLGSSLADFGDGRMNIPEKGNGVPDLLDEVRWEMEFLLKMQVPDGDRAGMAHHKIHDKEWTALGLAPHEDQMPRFLYPPSTTATLNLAAVTAQAARIWQSIDAPFSSRCLAAAERAWQAAQRHPTVFAPPGGVGGGPYEDNKVDDEFYWAAAELFITTKKPEYRKFLAASPYYLKVAPRLPSTEGGDIASPMTWQATAALGTISLAVVPNALGDKEIATARKAVTQAADAYLQILQKRGHRVPIDYGQAGKAPWGSNSFLLNNLVVLALANDFNHEQRYLNAVAAGMDYILGRNAMDQSYVTGWGSRPLRNPHHRFWAHQVNEKYPSAPPGMVSGGPNSGLEDPYVKAAALGGCAPEKCFADNIESWATNEICINWNAPLAWVLAYLDEKGSAK